MTREQIVNAMAQYANPDLFSDDVTIANKAASPQKVEFAKIDCRVDASTALHALEHIVSGLSDLIEGKAVIIPKPPLSEGAPEMISAEWGAWRTRHQGSVGPGPGFIEALETMLAANPYRSKT